MSPPPHITWFARLVAVLRALFLVQLRWLDLLRVRPGGAGGDAGAAASFGDAIAASFTSNAQALATELRETGELTQLLARAAAGHPLDAVERAKVRAQLIDVAKAVPALALLAAPGGLLLLPLLAKVLPWSLLPSAWDPPRAPVPRALPAMSPAPEAPQGGPAGRGACDAPSSST